MLDPFDMLTCFKEEIGKIRDDEKEKYNQECDKLNEESLLTEYIDFVDSDIRVQVAEKSIQEFKDFSDKLLTSISHDKCREEMEELIKNTKAKLSCCSDHESVNNMIDTFFFECGGILMDYLGPY